MAEEPDAEVEGTMSETAANYTVFRHLAIEGARPPPSCAQIEAIESLLGAKLPQRFVECLRVANGGYLEYVVVVLLDNGQTETLSFCGIFSAEEGQFCDEAFVGEIRAQREYAKIPEGVLPFARDGGGSLVYLDLSAEGRGRVVSFVQGLPPWTGKRAESAFIELASSFDEYVAMLRLAPPIGAAGSRSNGEIFRLPRSVMTPEPLLALAARDPA